MVREGKEGGGRVVRERGREGKEGGRRWGWKERWYGESGRGGEGGVVRGGRRAVRRRRSGGGGEGGESSIVLLFLPDIASQPPAPA